jgi:hypothetical protein
MQTVITKVQTRHGIAEFTNAQDGAAYARKHGGKVLNTANAAIDGIAQQPKSSMPVPSPALCALLGLNTSALSDPKEIAAAYEANGRKGMPRDTDKVVQGLISYWRTKRGCDVDDAVALLKKRHPLLFPSALYKTAGTSGSGANERLAANEEVMLAIGPSVTKFA